MKAEFIKPHDPRWKQFIRYAPHDFYHLPGYTVLSAKQEGGIPIAFYAETDKAAFLAPLLLREVPKHLDVPNGWYDVTTAYGYPTPLMVPSDDSRSLESFLDAFKRVGAERGIVSAFFRLHPLLPLPQEPLTKYGELVRHGQTVYVDLAQSDDDIWRQTRANHKTGIRKLLRAGFQTRFDDWGLFDEFMFIYWDTMRRLSADKFYLFPDSYFRELKLVFGTRLHLCTVLSPEGEVAAAGLFTETNGIMQYHLGATCNLYLRSAPSKLMFDAVRKWGKDMRYHVFHLGGGVGGRSDSLFQFKAGFSKLRADFYTFRMILDEEKYRFLVRSWTKLHGNTEIDDDGFFPAYRKGI